MRKTLLVFLVAAAVSLPLALTHAQAPPMAQSQKPLELYFIDTEGGKATVVVAPSGQTMLLDTGTGGDNDRDLNRILAVLKAANVTVLDYVIVSHYHGDHSGNLAGLAMKIPIRYLYDHGAWSTQGSSAPGFVAYVEARERLRASVPKPGDRIPITGLDVQVLSSAGSLTTAPAAGVGVPGAGAPNLLCRDAKHRDQDPTPENYEAVGLVLRYGSFRMLDLADLTWDQEAELVCPTNLIGTVDVYHVDRHGTDWSGNDVMVHAIRPRVAVMGNGPKKGGTPDTLKIIRSSPGFQDLWQLHYSENATKEQNTPDQFIAVTDGAAGHAGHYFKMSARPDGSFTMTNERTGFTKEYPAQKPAATR